MRPSVVTYAACLALLGGLGPQARARATSSGAGGSASNRVMLGLGGAVLSRAQNSSGRALSRAPGSRAQRSLTAALNQGMRAAGPYSGASVVDLTTGQTLYSSNASTARLPASVQKLYTTSATLAELGPAGTLRTQVLGIGVRRGTTFIGKLYLRGGGDPSFGSAEFDRSNYATGATMQALVGGLLTDTGIRSLHGSVVADETMFDARRGTPATGFAASAEVEGELSALSYNRGWADSDGTVYYEHPALQAGQQFVSALRAAGIRVPRRTSVTAGRTPSGAQPLARVRSPPLATLISLTNTPSDNFFAEMLLKDLGARYGGGGTTAGGTAVVRAQVARHLGLHPRFNDGSGLSRYDRTTPSDIVTLLSDLATNRPFTNSLAIAGETGTLQDEMRGTYAQGRCRGKTGTLSDVSNVVGYCRAADGHTLAYAFMMNGIYPDYAHPIQDRMQLALARYDG